MRIENDAAFLVVVFAAGVVGGFSGFALAMWVLP